MSFSTSLLQLFIISIFLLVYYVNIKNIKNKSIEFVKEIESFKNEMDLKEIKILQERNLYQLQLSHEMRSPIAALNSFLVKSEHLPDESRKLVRQAVHRIQDIAHFLVHKNQQSTDNNSYSINLKEAHSIQLLSHLIESLASEKRLQYREYLGIEILSELGQSSYGLFAKIPLLEFKNILSQIIDSSVESISNHGTVKIRLSSNLNNISLYITNSGQSKNIKFIPRMMESDRTRLKIESKGTALCHAKSVVESLGGKFEFQVQFGIGAAVKIILPKANEPEWFVNSFKIKPNSFIIIIDEDSSIHNIWQERFKNILCSEYNIILIHFSHPNEAIAWSESSEPNKMENKYYFCEFDFTHYPLNGLDFISMLRVENKSILITNKYTDKNILSLCLQSKIKIVPKDVLFFVPLEILKPKEKPCAILIDDDALIKMVWHLSAQNQNKNIVFYQSLEKFTQEFSMYDLNTPLFIDIEFTNKSSENKFTNEIYKFGFKYIYLTTGQNPKYYSFANWVKGITTKEPPWH